MLGYDTSWASFNVIEVMSQPRFTSKRIGYLAASQSFHEGTEVVMLATNLIRKDFQSNNQYDAGIAINCLANVCTPDLARDLATDIVALMNNSKPYVRKKAVLVMYKVFLRFPDSLRPSYGKLKEKLEDPDQAVISSAVNVICELARKNPKNYLSLAPTLFKLLTSNYNNWMLIKIIKLFGALTPLEPRLAKKLVEPLSNLINNTPATSLLYECIQTCTIGMGEQLSLIKLCITKLRSFVEDPDQNLKYLGLLALNNIMKIHPKAVAEHRDLVLTCLDDEDVTIRMRALDLLTGMVSKRNLVDIVRKLLEHIDKAEGAYRDDLVDKIILLCSQNTYAHVTDFEWYLTVLVQLTRVHGTPHGALIASQILDVLIRVEVVRPFGVKQMVTLLRDAHLFSNPTSGGICEVLYPPLSLT
jgi:AP-3 complex subunit delta-1